MIISASRRTDIPAFYWDWFENRIKEGYCLVPNPMNPKQISRVSLSRDVVDCLVFWTKNPAPVVERLDVLEGYDYYFQCTCTGVGRDIEGAVPDKQRVVLPAMRALGQQLGSHRVIWRYGPIVVNTKYDAEYNLRAFRRIAEELEGAVDTATIGFLRMYQKTRRNMKMVETAELFPADRIELAAEFAGIAREHGMRIQSCYEGESLAAAGVSPGACVDQELIERLIGQPIKGGKDKNQPDTCLCHESIDIGTYNTCLHQCKYCYANYSESWVQAQSSLYDSGSEILCGQVGVDDIIKERRMYSLRQEQFTMNL